MIRVILSVKRCENINSESYVQTFECQCSEEFSISQVLEMVNENNDNPVQWECSCRQKMCGACAMLIQGVPKLACATFVKEFVNKKKNVAKISLAPLSKFPLICDLKVDRSIIYDNFEKAKLWVEKNAEYNKKELRWEYDSAKCLMCGCCYEVCPNYCMDGDFEGAGAMNATYRIVSQTQDKIKKKELKKEYRKNGMGKCSRSLACESVCPAGIPLSVTMSRLNSKILI